MKRKIKYSLIVATYGRVIELDLFLGSIAILNYDITKLEIIIVDQNPDGYLRDLLSKYINFNIIHYPSNKRGLSYNRNLGSSLSSGEILCFPDDDCHFYPDTFAELDNLVRSHRETPFFIGSIYSRKNNKYLFKNWPSHECDVTPFNFYLYSSSITMFIRKDFFIPFDENMGVGSIYGSCEDVDLIYRILKISNLNGFYSPLVQVNHPDPQISSMPLTKVNSYASGFGYFIRKEFNYIKGILLLLLLVKKFIQFIQSILKRNFKKKYFINFFLGLYTGLFKAN